MEVADCSSWTVDDCELVVWLASAVVLDVAEDVASDWAGASESAD